MLIGLVGKTSGKGKIYKEEDAENIRMFPSDLSRSLDVFFLRDFLSFKGRFL